MNRLEQFLLRATRGLWGRKRLEVMAELRGSVEARVWKLECQGKTPEHALETALLEMGKPRHISTGLMRIHTMPKVLQNTVLFGLFLTSSLTFLSITKAQVEVLVFPAYSDQSTREGINLIPGYHISFSSLKKNLEDLKLTVDPTSTPLVESVLASRDPVPTLRFRLPDASKETIIQVVPGVSAPYRNPNGFLTYKPMPPADLALENVFIDPTQLVYQLRRTGLPIRLEGWKNPVLHIGQTKFQLGNDTQSFLPSNLYGNMALSFLFTPATPWKLWGFTNFNSQYAVRVNAPAGTVYGIGTPFGGDGIELYYSLGRVSEQGILYFIAPHAALEFVQTGSEVYQDRLKTGELNYGLPLRPAKALLVRLENDLQTKTIEVPANKRTVAIK
jgi:hypothetical protein